MAYEFLKPGRWGDEDEDFGSGATFGVTEQTILYSKEKTEGILKQFSKKSQDSYYGENFAKKKLVK
jgi:hypothetical protein